MKNIKARNWLVTCSNRLENNMQQNLNVFFKYVKYSYWVSSRKQNICCSQMNRRKCKNKLSLESLNFSVLFGFFCETFSLNHLYLKKTRQSLKFLHQICPMKSNTTVAVSPTKVCFESKKVVYKTPKTECSTTH